MKTSAGILLYRVRNNQIEVLLAHPGGPIFAHRDEGAWSILKGELEKGETLTQAAIREFEEESGIVFPISVYSNMWSLGFIHQKCRYTPPPHRNQVYGYALKCDQYLPNHWEPDCPTFQEGGIQCPEIDRVQFYPISRARYKINKNQIKFLDILERLQFSKKSNQGCNTFLNRCPPDTKFLTQLIDSEVHTRVAKA